MGIIFYNALKEGAVRAECGVGGGGFLSIVLQAYGGTLGAFLCSPVNLFPCELT